MNNKKVFAVMMSALMMVSYMPAMAFADVDALSATAPTTTTETTTPVAAMVAKIGDKEYESLAAAMAEAKDGDTVKILADAVLDARVDVNITKTEGTETVAGKLTIDLNNKQLGSTANCVNGSVFNIVAGNVTIKNGKLVGIEGPTGQAGAYANECDVITVRSGATANLEKLEIEVDSKTGACAYAFDGGKIFVKSGKYTNQGTVAGGEKLILNQADNKAQAIFVSGGTFFGRNPMAGDNSGNPSSFFAEGAYAITSKDGSVTVKIRQYFVNYKNDIKASVEALKETTDTAAITAKIDAALAAVEAYKYDAAKDDIVYEEEFDEILEDVIKETDPLKFEVYRDAVKAKMHAKLVGTSVAIQTIIGEGETAINTVVYDATKTLKTNKKAVDAVFDEYVGKINDQLAAELKPGVTEVKASIKSITAYKNGKIKISINVKEANEAVITGYQIYRATNKSFSKNLKKYSTTLNNTTLKTKGWTNSSKLKKGTRYYYKVRGVVTLPNGTKAYTQWSGYKSIKCKKSR